MVTPIRSDDDVEADPRTAVEAERAVLACMLTSADAVQIAGKALTVDDFWQTRHGVVFAACLALSERGVAVEPVSVLGELRRTGQLATVDGGTYLHTLYALRTSAVNAAWHARQIRTAAQLRRIDQGAARIRQIVAEVPDPDDALTAVARETLAMELIVDDVGEGPVPGVSTWDEFTASKPNGERWIVPGLIRRGDTIMVLGAAGSGKSFLSRMVAQGLAAGVHPFTLDRITPVRTLLVDLENSPDQVAEEAVGPLAQVQRLGEAVGDRGWIWSRPEGINLREPRDAALLERVIAQTEPDVLCLGSLKDAYRRGRSDWDVAALETQDVFKRLRSRYGLGLWLEHHMPRKEGSGHTGTPFGGMLWESWPTHGRWLRRVGERVPLYTLEATFRGDRGERPGIPIGLQRGGRLPFTAIFDEGELEILLEAAGARQ